MPPAALSGGEIYVEYRVQGNVVKVTAIDPGTGTEASIMGPASAPRAPLTDAAVRKLKFVLAKKSG